MKSQTLYDAYTSALSNLKRKNLTKKNNEDMARWRRSVYERQQLKKEERDLQIMRSGEKDE